MKKRAGTKKPLKAKASTKSVAKPAAKTAKAYTPTPIQGIGRAPFRYPLS